MGNSTTFRGAAIASTCLADRVRSDRIWESKASNGIPLQQVGFMESVYSHVRRFKKQACKFLACPSSYSAWPLLGKAGGTIMKRRLIML